jgi:hypothetical protein
MIEIPLTSYPDQRFNIALDSISYEMRVIYNTRSSIWTLDIAQGNIEILNGIPLLLGGDIMRPFTTGPSRLFVFNIGSSSGDATSENLGSGVRLYQLTASEIANVASV